MVLSRKRNLLVVVLGFATAALAADRLIPVDDQGTPSRASASVLNVLSRTSHKTTPARIETINTATLVDESLAERLEKLSSDYAVEPTNSRDAFCPSQSWLAELRPETTITSNEARIQNFLQNHRLKAVVTFNNKGAAIIDDKYLPVGGELDGFKLIKVSERSAMFDCEGAQVTLKIEVKD